MPLSVQILNIKKYIFNDMNKCCDQSIDITILILILSSRILLRKMCSALWLKERMLSLKNSSYFICNNFVDFNK